jgi:hypothetical protein
LLEHVANPGESVNHVWKASGNSLRLLGDDLMNFIAVHEDSPHEDDMYNYADPEAEWESDEDVRYF